VIIDPTFRRYAPGRPVQKHVCTDAIWLTLAILTTSVERDLLAETRAGSVGLTLRSPLWQSDAGAAFWAAIYMNVEPDC
jgi:hypothetical protein